MAFTEENYQSQSNSECALPDPAICRVRRAEVSGFFYCLTPNSASCQHAEPHADQTYCFHPDPTQLKS